MEVVDGGGRSMLKTTFGGLLVTDAHKKRVLKFDLTSNDLFSLAESLAKRENTEKEYKKER